MAEFADLDDACNGDLYLPWRGRKWIVAEPSAAESERLRILAFTNEMIGNTEIGEYRKLLGQTWNDLIDAGIGWAKLIHFGRTAMVHFTGTPELAEHYWHSGRLMTLMDLDILTEKAGV